MLRKLVILISLVVLASCGSGSDDIQVAEGVVTGTPPVVSSVEPNSGAIGTTITIYGYGFSFIPQNDIVIIGDQATTAASHTFLDESVATAEAMESLTVTVPANVASGSNSVVVNVGTNASNSNITFTVTP